MSDIINNIRYNLLREEKKVRIFLIVFYSVGVFGITLSVTRNLFISLTPFALFLSLVALVIYHQPVSGKKSFIIFFSIFLLGYFIEVTGVKTGLIFGSYSYGTGLGVKVLGTPLMIGFNWMLLVYCTSVIVKYLPLNMAGKIFIASLLMVLYDIVLELVAPVLDMWHFESGSVPLINYLSWFIIALLLHLILKLSGITYENRIAFFIFILQFTFFIVFFTIYKLMF